MCLHLLTLTAVLTAGSLCLAAGENGPALLYYTFDKGSGNIARDASGNGHHGTVKGGQRKRLKTGYALSLDGRDDYVECRTAGLNFTKEDFSVQAWVKPAELTDNSSIATNFFNRQGGYVGWRFMYMANGTLQFGTANLSGAYEVSRSGGAVVRGVWQHVAMTKSGRAVTFYKNGVIVAAKTHRSAEIRPSVPLLRIGLEANNNGHLNGLIDEVRIYGRCLLPGEVLADFKRTAPDRMADIGIGEQVKVKAPAPGSTRAGKVGVATVGGGKPKALKNIKVLNNLVAELLNIENPGEDASHLFSNPREGFIFVRVEGGNVAPKVTLGGPGKQVRQVAMRLVGRNYEGILHCPKGAHSIVVRGGPMSRLIVRAIGELVYDVYGFKTGPYLPELGNYNWKWLRKHVLDSYNVIIGNPGAEGYSTLEEDEGKISEWASEGKWWTTRTYPIRDWQNRGFEENVEKQYQIWSKTPGAWHPLMKGFWVDEFLLYLESEKKGALPYSIYNKAMQRVVNDPKFKGRRVYGYVGSRSAQWCRELFRTILTSGGRTAREWYLFEGRKTVKGIESWDMGLRRNWEKLVPGTHSTNLIVVLGTASSPCYSYDIYPHLNWNAWLDMQMEYVATSPTFKDAAGVSGWYNSYMAEEQVRLLAQLIRHYAIEGRTDRYLADPLVLTHLTNPDFREGVEGWALEPAEGGTISPVVAKGFGVLQSRMRANWPQYKKVDPHLGDTALLTRRSVSGPNRFSQQLRHLQPGRLYSLRFYTGNYRDMLEGRSRLYPHALSVQISGGAELLPANMMSTCGSPLQFDVYKYPKWQAARIGDFNRDNPYGWNYHQRIFRAKDTTAHLTFSDWASDKNPGGKVGQELIWNFVQLQPYFGGETQK